MTTLAMIRRNCKLFFKDKGIFFTSLITPLILLVLYATFLANVYRDSFLMTLPEGMTLPEEVVNGLVGGQLLSSLLAVSTVTVSFCANMLMVQDKITGAANDFRITPIKRSSLAISYYVATAISTLIISFTALGACMIYLAFVGWYLSFDDILLLLLDVFLLSMFGTALSSIINHFLTSQGQISAVGSIVSAGYGFICGAYMPISSFSEGLQKVISFLPGTYGTSLLRNHALAGVFGEMETLGIPAFAIDAVKDAIDCNLYFFDNKVSTPVMYLVLTAAVILVLSAYILLHASSKKKKG